MSAHDRRRELARIRRLDAELEQALAQLDRVVAEADAPFRRSVVDQHGTAGGVNAARPSGQARP